MPNISATRLSDLTDKAVRYERLAANNERQLATATALAAERGEALNQVDRILDKIVRAATGFSLDTSGWSASNGVSIGAPSCPCQVREPSAAEKAADEARQMLERLINLESRLRAVVAVAQFAKEHKA